MRTTIDIERYLLERLRSEAHEEGIPFKDVVNRAIRRGLEGEHREGGESYQCPTFAMGAPFSPLDKALLLADSLEEEELARKLALRK